MIVGGPVFYVDSNGVKRPALVKAITSKVENDAAHRLAAATQPFMINLEYVDATGTTQTVNGVKPHALVAPATTNFYTEA